jgi:hypothetical protein
MLPPSIEKIDIPMFGLLGHQLHVHAVTLEIGQAVSPEGVGQAAGMSGFTVADVIEGRSLG